MLSRSTADGAGAEDAPGADGLAPTAIDRIRLPALACLMLFTLLTQLDAVSNRLSVGLPFSLIELTLAALVLTTALLLLTPGAEPAAARGSAGARLMLALLLWAVIAWTLSQHRSEGLRYLIGLATAVLPALCLLVVADRPGHLRALIWTAIAAGAVSAAIVLVEARTGTRLVATAPAAITADFDGVARSSGGSDQNPTTAAQMLLASVALALGLLFAGERRGRLFLVGAIALGGVALVLMSARSAILGLAAAALLTLWSFRRKPYFPIVLFAALVVGALGVLFAPPTLLERFAAIGDFSLDPTLFRRITYLRIGTDLLARSPIWGIGPGNFPLYYIDDAYRYLPGRFPFPRELHNTYLDAAVEYGLVGFALFAVLIGHALVQVRRGFAGGAVPALARIGFAVAVALTSLLVACFFMPHKDLRYLWLLLAMAIQCGRICGRTAR